ncbi:hypothetical protein JKF63_06581 [Porcisia hertigi]|uniref:GPI mannosyltransferase 2 n=1 Tax=Porcisia hertigi TaxID=2761500 RepID=A0A836IKK6_9TRYP|nr:hypothetical protein JKF63_06581 [Porcisia hertigi]
MAFLRYNPHAMESCSLTLMLEVYTGLSFNLLDYLGTCTDTALVGCVAVARLLLLCLMYFSRTIAPVIFRAPGRSFVFDTSEELYDDARFSMVRHWDGVHMFFIAQEGYVYENQLVFFPGLPTLIRGLELVTRRLLPFLHSMAPVAFYVCLVNIAASCLAGVVLRRLTILTLLGPEAVQHTCRWRSTKTPSSAPESKKKMDTHAKMPLRVETEETAQSTTDAAILYRIMGRMTGTMLDVPDDHAPLPRTLENAKTRALQLRRAVGGAALVWIITPATVFTVAVYTESLFALVTMIGMYLLAWHEPLPWTVQLRIASLLESATAPGSAEMATQTAPTSVQPLHPTSLTRRWVMAPNDIGNDATAHGHIPGFASLLRNITPGAPKAITVEWEQSFLSRAEVTAVLLFMLAGTLRSNAITYAGFLLFPFFMQLVLPAVYRAQASAVLAGVSARTVMSLIAKQSGVKNSRLILVARCPTLHPPLQRMPHPLRICIVVLECICVALPYCAMNYMGYRRFVLPMWDATLKARIGHAFWNMYPLLQEKYWGVSAFSAYTLTNIPNVLLALPVASLAAWCIYARYWAASAWSTFGSATGAAARARRTKWQRVWDSVVPLLCSSNVVHLIVLLALALTIMNVQVTNRFVMASPALCWLLGGQLAAKPRCFVSQLILLWGILWGMMGGVLFPNHLPWT